MSSARSSDRWVTPGVIVAGILTAGVVVLGIGAGVVYLTANGRDPDPILRLVAQIVTAVGSLGTLLLQLANRQTVAKTERNTGLLAREVAYVAEAVEDSGRHHTPEPADLAPVELTQRHPLVPVPPGTRTAPARNPGRTPA